MIPEELDEIILTQVQLEQRPYRMSDPLRTFLRDPNNAASLAAIRRLWTQMDVACGAAELIDELGHTPVLRHTLELIAAGWRQADIAVLDGVTDSAIIHRLDKIRQRRNQ